MSEQARYRADCPDCHGTGRVERYIGHPGRIARFVCYTCADLERFNARLIELGLVRQTAVARDVARD